MTIPDSVTSIGQYAFSGCSGLASVYITDLEKWCSISFGSGSLWGCDGANPLSYAHNLYLDGCLVVDLTIPDSVTSIGSWTFFGCSGLKSVTIPDSVTNIGEKAFSGCSGLTSVTIPNSVTSIGEKAFSGCSGLTSMTIPNSVTSIGREEFSGCSGLTSVTIPDGVTSIGYQAFQDCSSLLNVTIPDSVTSLGLYAFENCSSLASVKIGKGITSIGSRTFHGCCSLTSLTISEGLKSIGNEAFYGCRGLTSVTIPDSVTSIGSSAFSYCSGLESVTIPNSVTSIGEGAFRGCGGLESLTIPDSVTSIGEHAFSGCGGLKSLIIGIGVTSIEPYAFSGCSGLTSVKIGNGVTSIGEYAFAYCSGLTSVTIGNGVKGIGGYAFRGCSGLTSVTIPDNVMYIGDGVFSGCSGLEEITLPFVGDSRGGSHSEFSRFGYIFGKSSYIGDMEIIYGYRIPSKLKKVVITDETVLGSQAFDGCKGLTSVTMHGGVTSIDDSAFAHCTGLMSVTIPDTVTSIGDQAFYCCSRLANVTIPDGVTSIGYEAFYGCSGLANIAIPGGVTNIGDYAFAYCTGLTGVTIPDSVTSIGSSVFNGCTGLTSVTIPDSITSIGEGAFNACSGLKSVTIPDSVTSIGSGAFSDCGSLEVVFVDIGDGERVKELMANAGFDVSSAFFVEMEGNESLVVFAGNGGTVDEPWRKVTSGSMIGSLPTPVRLGCRFEGWWTSARGGVQVSEQTVVTDRMACFVYYAHWAPVSGSGPLLRIDSDGVLTGIEDMNDGTEIVIPSGVTSIGCGALSGCIWLTSVTMPDSVTNIEEYAFSGCSGLTSITIPGSVVSIGEGAFEDCSGLVDVSISEGVANIGELAFSGCTGLESLTIPKSVISIGDAALSRCWGLREITLPFIGGCRGSGGSFNSLFRSKYGIPSTLRKVVITDETVLGNGAFNNCSGLTDLIISASVTNIWERAFSGCSGLLSVTIPQCVCSTSMSKVFPEAYKSITDVAICNDVTIIGRFAFVGCDSLARVTIPDSVTSIVYGAFEGLGGLAEVTFGNGLMDIDDFAFSGCTSLASVAIPNSVTNIGGFAFSDCTSIASLVMPDSVTRIGRSAFSGCSGLGEVTFGNGLLDIDEYAFRGCTSLANVTIPGSVTNIGSSAFSSCTSLLDVAISGSVTNMGERVFAGCSGLATVTIGDGVTAIGVYAFSNCSNLTSVTIPMSVTRIRDGAFYNCSRLTSVTIPQSVTDIGDYAFNGCKGLVSIMIPDSVTRIGYHALDNCSGLASITVAEGNPSYKSVNGALLSRDGRTFVRGVGGDVTIPDGVKSIKEGAFSGCSGLTNVTIPDGVTDIGYSAFSGCVGLVSVTIPNSVMSIGNGAFSGCIWLGRVYVADGDVVRIKGLMKKSGFNVVSVSFIEPSTPIVVFDANGGSVDESERRVTPGGAVGELPEPTWNGHIFVGWFTERNDGTEVSAETVVTGRVTYYAHWSDTPVPRWTIDSNGVLKGFQLNGCTEIVIPSRVKAIGSSAFSGCGEITSVVIPSSVTNIESGAFRNCSGLKSVTIQDGVTSIGEGAFRNCSGLKSVTIPDSVTSIGSDAFSGCSGLEEIALPFVGSRRGNSGCYDSVFGYIFGGLSYTGGTQTCQYYTYSACHTYYIPSKLRKVVITDETVFGQGAFNDCSGLASVTIPDSVTNIGANAFSGCDGLETMYIPDVAKWCRISFANSSANPLGLVHDLYIDGVLFDGRLTIPDGVTGIGDYAFCRFGWLASVMMPAGVTNIGGHAFWNCTNLTSVALPESVVQIKEGAFSGCCGLSDISIPNSATKIGASAFSGCSGLTSVTIPDGVAGIMAYTFSGCSGLESVTIPDSVTSIGYLAFEGCSGIRSVSIPDGVTSIESSAFKGCTGLKNVAIPKGIKNLGDSTFEGCTSLESVTMPDGITSIARWGFRGCSSLAYIRIPDGVTEIGTQAFYGCSSLTCMKIPDGVTRIGTQAFYGCSKLESMSIPRSVMNIGEYAFYGCDGLKRVYAPRNYARAVRSLMFSSGLDLNRVSFIEAEVLCITFDANGGSVAPDYCYCVAWTAVDAFPTPTRPGFTFAGWWTAKTGGMKVASLPCVTTSEKFYAHWEEEGSVVSSDDTFTVTFNANGGSVKEAKRTVAGGSTVGNLPKPTRAGYVSSGWWMSDEGGVQVDESYVVCESVTFYAQWILDGIDIAIDSEWFTDSDGSISLDLTDAVYSGSTPKVTVKGLPPGLTYDAKTMTIGGKATKPGVYTVTVSATNANVKKPVTETFDIVVANLTSEVLPGLKAATDAYGTIRCGVTFNPAWVDCSPEDGWTVKVAGLPAGLKYDAKTGKITGVPTKAGTYTVTFTVTNGKEKEVATITLNVEALPIWATGTFAGVAGTAYPPSRRSKSPWRCPSRGAIPVRGAAGTGTFAGSVKCKMENVKLEEVEIFGFATMTVAANGKISGKIALEGTNWTFSAASYAAVRRAGVIAPYQNGGEECFIVEAEAKAGKATRPVVLEVAACDGGGTDGGRGYPPAEGCPQGGCPSRGAPALPNAVAEGTFGEGEVKMWRNMWKDKATASEAKATIAGFEGVYTVSIADGAAMCGSGYLSLTVGKNGDVKASGKLADGTGVSTTSPLVYDEDAGWLVMLYAAPSAYKGGCFAAAVGFDDRLASVLFTPMWTSKNPQATGDYGEGFDREVNLVGAYYSKLDTLRKYYESVRLDLDGAPELGFTFKETSLNEQGKKVTTSSTATAEAVDTLLQPGLTATVNEKGAIVVAKATKPVQDKATKEWFYDGTNDGAMTLSFAQATGIFKGSYTFWYDYVSACDETKAKDNETRAHTSKKVSFEGILVQGKEPKMDGFYLWDATGEYVDEKTGKTKTYKYKQSFPVRLFAE